MPQLKKKHIRAFLFFTLVPQSLPPSPRGKVYFTSGSSQGSIFLHEKNIAYVARYIARCSSFNQFWMLTIAGFYIYSSWVKQFKGRGQIWTNKFLLQSRQQEYQLALAWGPDTFIFYFSSWEMEEKSQKGQFIYQSFFRNLYSSSYLTNIQSLQC